MVTDPTSCQGSQTSQPLKQLILNSHSPVLFSALMNHSRPGAFQALNGGVIFADTATSVDPDRYETRHHTRLRLIDSGNHQRRVVRNFKELGDYPCCGHQTSERGESPTNLLDDIRHLYYSYGVAI